MVKAGTDLRRDLFAAQVVPGHLPDRVRGGITLGFAFCYDLADGLFGSTGLNRHASVFGLHGVQACRRGNDRAGAM